MKIENDFIPYEQALALKELGFDEPCFAITNGDKLFYGEFKSTHEYYKESGQILYQQAFRWFREKYNLYHVITIADLGKYESGNPDFQCAIYSKDPVVITKMDNYKTYEEAELYCLDKLIEIVKPK